MIVRSWSARTTRAHLSAYVEHVRRRVLPELRAIDGFRGASVLQREVDGAVEIVVQTQWDSLEAIRRFAGADAGRAVVEDAAAAMLTEFDQRAKHYEVALEDNPEGRA
ncbi:MAG TPA: antibiotic biosynthesis monooxygenase [Thermomicrobiales bacterium]|nr:antibiotic biosynthesis monooxygenase [Thermomicrobiales bacterium]